MKSLTLSLILLALFYCHYSIAQTSDDPETTPTTVQETTTSWWTRTLPIIVTRTRPPRPVPPRRTTTPLVRVSDTVTIVVPVVLFAVTLIGGFGALYFIRGAGRRGRNFQQDANVVLAY